MEVVEIEKPKSRKEHKSNIYPGLRKRGETKEELTDDFINYEDDFSIR